jgi:hypothetical protein
MWLAEPDAIINLNNNGRFKFTQAADPQITLSGTRAKEKVGIRKQTTSKQL